MTRRIIPTTICPICDGPVRDIHLPATCAAIIRERAISGVVPEPQRAPVPIPHPLWNVAKALLDAGVTQRQLAEELDVSDSHVSNLIRGLIEADEETIEDIRDACEALGVVNAC